ISPESVYTAGICLAAAGICLGVVGNCLDAWNLLNHAGTCVAATTMLQPQIFSTNT
nr:hypothetical protein [Tanacetum cinerariifolium]